MVRPVETAIEWTLGIGIGAIGMYASYWWISTAVTLPGYDPTNPAALPWAWGGLTVIVLIRIVRWLSERDVSARLADNLSSLFEEPLADSDRGAIHLVDVIMTVLVLVVILRIAPTIYTFVGMASSSAGPLTSLLLSLVVTSLLLALILGIGISARRGA